MEHTPETDDEPPEPSAALELLAALAMAYVATNSRKKGLAAISAALTALSDDGSTAVIPFKASRLARAKVKARREARVALVALLPRLMLTLPGK